MCILSYLGPNIPADEDGLLNGGLSNPDGHGWAITDRENNRIVVGKSMDLIEALDGFLAARAELPGEHALFHSRWATHGTLDTSNVHPFTAGHSDLTVVAHNGILPREAHPAKGDSRSDTRLFADEILSTRYRRLNRERVRQALAGWITTANKLVILTVDPRYRQNAYLINPSQGVWDQHTGIWHSNYDFETTPRWLGKWNGYASSSSYWQSPGKGKTSSGRTFGYNAKTGKWEDDESPRQAALALRAAAAEPTGADGFCVYCDDLVNAGGICTACGTCQDCLEIQQDCQCFTRAIESAQQRDDDAEYERWQQQVNSKITELFPRPDEAQQSMEWEDDIPRF